MPYRVVIHDKVEFLMAQTTENDEKFTGLILLTGVDRPGIANELFKTLAQFVVHIVDIEQIVISDRLILTVLITLNPAHEKVIEVDLQQCGQQFGIDIATIFSPSKISIQKQGLVRLSIKSVKLHPRDLNALTQGLFTLGANIESIRRICTSPTEIELAVSGITMEHVTKCVADLVFETTLDVAISQP